MHLQKLQKIFAFLILYIPFGQIFAAPVTKGDLEFIILHNNDMHARFEQTGVNSNKCSDEDAAQNKCYGGFARTAHEIRKFRTEAKQPGGTPVLYLNAGDTYTGTPWFAVFRDNITAEFLNLLKPDAISLGNHEFDEGVEGLVPFLNEVNFPVLTANLDLRETPELENTKALKNSTIFEINGVKIGVIGYLTPETKKMAIPNKVEFYPEIESINKEAKVLKSQGVNIFIALGHSGFAADQDIAKNCPLIDIVIGGHTNTFLYNGKKPSIEKSEGPYPVVVKQSNGKKVPVVQAYAYTKYLGKLKVKFDSTGKLLEFNGQPILLDSSIPQDEDVLHLLDLYRPNITELERSVVGYTKVILQGASEICRRQECNLGNLIADSMVYARAMELKETTKGFWTDASIAFIQGGGIRASIDKKPDGSITKNDILTVLPFKNDLVMPTVTGKSIRKALERSASKLDDLNSNGGFLQMSGVQVVYDWDKPIGNRVLSANVLCAECDVPKYSPLEDEKLYKIILPSFLLAGGDGYQWIDGKDPLKNSTMLKVNDVQAAIDYIAARNPIYPGVEWRITINGMKSKMSSSSAFSIGANNLNLTFIAIVASFILKFY